MAQVIRMPNDAAAWLWRRAYRAANPGRGCRLYHLALRQSTATKARVQRLLSIRKGVETRRLQRLVKETAARVCRPFPDTRRMALRRKAWRDAVLIMKYIGGVEPKLGGPAIIEGPIPARVWTGNKWRGSSHSVFRVPVFVLAVDGGAPRPRRVYMGGAVRALRPLHRPPDPVACAGTRVELRRGH
jgi:hypothetical protein